MSATPNEPMTVLLCMKCGRTFVEQHTHMCRHAFTDERPVWKTAIAEGRG